MTNRNFPLKADGPAPFLLKPVGKDYLWGGRRLNDEFSKNIALFPLAETWECSTHPDGVSTIASGGHTGKLLTELLREHSEYIGNHPKTVGELPILIKLIDAKQDLSVQVHPDDKYARLYENGQRGKSEFWYVLDAARDATLVYGLNQDMDRESLLTAALDSNLEKYLQRVRVRRDDLFYIPAGTIHAIGAGALIAEIQESSNLTYRLYDYDRRDKYGQKRPLHLEKALDVAQLRRSPEPTQPMRVLQYKPGCAAELLCRCPYFEVHRMLVNTERCRDLIRYRADEASFRVLLCTKGCGSLYFKGEALRFFRGDCIFVPAGSAEILIHGNAQFLDVRG